MAYMSVYSPGNSETDHNASRFSQERLLGEIGWIFFLFIALYCQSVTFLAPLLALLSFLSRVSPLNSPSCCLCH